MKLRKAKVVLLFGFLTVLALESGEEPIETWTSLAGNSVEAKLASVTPSAVFYHRKGGGDFHLNRLWLCMNDQERILQKVEEGLRISDPALRNGEDGEKSHRVITERAIESRHFRVESSDRFAKDAVSPLLIVMEKAHRSLASLPLKSRDDQSGKKIRLVIGESSGIQKTTSVFSKTMRVDGFVRSGVIRFTPRQLGLRSRSGELSADGSISGAIRENLTVQTIRALLGAESETYPDWLIFGIGNYVACQLAGEDGNVDLKGRIDAEVRGGAKTRVTLPDLRVALFSSVDRWGLQWDVSDQISRSRTEKLMPLLLVYYFMQLASEDEKELFKRYTFVYNASAELLRAGKRLKNAEGVSKIERDDPRSGIVSELGDERNEEKKPLTVKKKVFQDMGMDDDLVLRRLMGESFEKEMIKLPTIRASRIISETGSIGKDLPERVIGAYSKIGIELLFEPLSLPSIGRADSSTEMSCCGAK